MPTIATFYGIIISMYFRRSEHNPPHFHVYYGDYEALIEIKTLTIFKGELPNKILKMVVAWASTHQKELIDMWENENIHKLPSLK